MSHDLWYFDSSKLEDAGERYVEEGAPATKALRREEVDGAKAFLGSDAAKKLRVASPQSPHGIHDQRPVRTVLDAVGTTSGKAPVEKVVRAPAPLTPIDEEDLRDA